MSTSFQSCPKCESFILADTYQCPECEHVFDEVRANAAASLTKDLENQSMYDTCRGCGESVRSGLVRCWNCNKFMRKDVEARYEQMQSSPQQIIFSDVPQDERTELIDRREEDNHADVYDAQGEDDFEFTLRSGDAGETGNTENTGNAADDDDGFELSPSRPQPQATPAAQVTPAAAPQTPVSQASTPASTPADTPAPKAPAAVPEAGGGKPADTPPADKPPAENEQKAPDDFDVNDLIGIALQDQKETRKRKKKKVDEARSKRILMPCNRCGAWIRVHQEQGGRTLRCRQCKFPFIVPQMKKKGPSQKGSKSKSVAAKIEITWLDDVRFHVVSPTDIVLKPGSLEKSAAAIDLGFHETGLHVLTYAPPAKKSLFGKADGPPTTEEQRRLVRAHIEKTGAIAGLPFGDLHTIDTENLSKVRLVQPVAEAHESMFAGVPVFGNGRIALYLPLASEDNKQSFVSLAISEYRKLAAQLKERFGTEINAEQNGVPAADESDTLKCKISEMPVTSVKHVEYYENDPAYELELSGYLCGTCGIAVGEPARAQQKLGGVAGKGIAKAKCPGCSNKMGKQEIFKISKAPSADEDAGDNDEEDPSSVMTQVLPVPASQAAAAAAAGLTSEAIQGKWKMLSLGQGGSFDKPDDMSQTGIEFAVDGDKYTVTAGGAIQEQGTISIVSSENPAHLDQQVTEGADAGKAHLGLARIVDGKLQNCQAAFGEPRPKGFESEAGSTDTLAIFERA